MTRESKVDIPKHKNAQWQKFLSNIQMSFDKSDKAFRTHLSRIYKSRSLPFYKLSKGTKIVSKQEGITNELFQYYSEQLKVPAVNYCNEHEGQINRKYKELVNRLSALNDNIEKTSTAEITCIIKILKPKKSTGFDSVSNVIIKKLPPTYIECRYPDDWKIAKIITRNKLKSSILKCEKICPISLLATHSKLVEKLLLLRIRHWAATNRLVTPEQSGFRPKCLLPTPVLSIYQEAKNNMVANILTLALYVCKLEAMGLPQDSSLSPYLLIVFHADLTNYLGAHSCHLFGDDLCLLIKSPTMKKLGSMIDQLENEGTRVCNQ
ncbi:unnamed protein product, partial [Rotaria socialis]